MFAVSSGLSALNRGNEVVKCVNCGKETGKPYVAGGSGFCCRPCAEIKYNAGIRADGAITLGIMPAHFHWDPPPWASKSEELSKITNHGIKHNSRK